LSSHTQERFLKKNKYANFSFYLPSNFYPRKEFGKLLPHLTRILKHYDIISNCCSITNLDEELRDVRLFFGENV